MGQKVSPRGFRVGVIQDWDSKWYANKKNFAEYLAEDNKVREFIKKELYAAGVSKVVIERAAENQIRVSVLTRNPGMVIGRGGDGIDQLKTKLEKITKKAVTVSIVEVKKPDADAQLAAESVAQALEKRVAFRRAMKQTIQRTMKAGAKGIKVVISGRVGGAEIARSEKYSEGNVPLHTLRANIDYGFAEADTQYGRIGVKVWVNNGEYLDKALLPAIPEEKEEKKGGRDGRRGNRQRRDNDKYGRNDRNSRSRNYRNEEEKPKKAVNPRKRPNKPAPAPVEEAAAEAAAEVTATVEE
ncbi:MAG: 30S ribosomal protein S3 [Firmicutes bacterium]|nr:30S ribosomal protein S3 [Bacillota bacterium]